jgi:ABC-type nitrate/sulfonate/bicarbonate transport system substrate-binding protein
MAMGAWRRSLLLACGFVLGLWPGAARAQTRSNYASSITSESMASIWIAKDLKFFNKYGLETQFITMSRSPLAVAALLAGEIDLAIIGPGHLVNASIGGGDLIGIANLVQKLDYRLNSRPEIKKKEDLRGKRLAISGPGATSHLVALLALQNMGMDANRDRIAFLTIPGTEINRRLALESGSVDATTLNGSVGDIYGNKGYPVLFNFKGSGVTMPQTMVVTTRRITASKPKVIEAYLKGLIEAIAYLLEPANKEGVTRTIATNLRLSNTADAEEAYKAVVNAYERVPYPTIDGMKRLHGLLTAVNPKLAEAKVETLIDDSFVHKIEASGFVQTVAKKR